MANKFQERTAALAGLIPDGYDGALIISEINGRYFTGFNCDNGYFIVTRGGCVYVTDSRYTEAAGKAIDWCEVAEYPAGKMKETFGGISQKMGLKSLLVESDRMTLSQYAMMSEVLAPAVLSEKESLDRLIESLRVHKDSDEIACMKAAQNIAEQTLTHLYGMIREGVTEADLAFEFEFYARRLGAERLAFDSIVASGENGSMPHAVPGQRRIRKGDFITFDVGCVVDGYHSDMTRTVAYGNICDGQREIYDIVLRAQQAAMDYLFAGGDDLAECDAAARDLITAAGYGEYFGHGTGHGVGLEIHEFPSVSFRGGKIPVNSVITVEPGIYLPGKYGVRIENMLYKTADGAVDLTSLDRKLLILE
jgi:Xaa-Pro aminopeptidase